MRQVRPRALHIAATAPMIAARPAARPVPPSSRQQRRVATRATAVMAGPTEFEVANARGQRLVGYEFLPASGKPWATLVWNHGVCEHAGRYRPVFQHLADAGVAVYTFDVHGHGKSEPTAAVERGLIHRHADLVDDLYTFLAVVETRAGGRLPADSTFLGGQSMGGLVAALGALRCQERWAGLVVFSGAMGVVWTPVLRVQAMVGNLLASLAPRVQLVPAVKPELLHPDEAVVAAFRDDPLIFHGDLRVRTANELLKGMHALAARRTELSLPIYAVHGTKDAVTSCDAIEEFAAGVSSPDVTLTKVDGGYHEMLMGDERLGSADALLAWMRGRVGKAREGGAPLAEAAGDGGAGSGSSKL